MVPGPVIHTRQRQAHYHAGQYLSYDRDVVCGTLYVTVPITWLRISSTRSESYQPLVLVAFPQVLLEPLEPALPVRIEPLEPALPGQVALPADVAHVHLEHALDVHPVDAVDAGYAHHPALVVGLLADADHDQCVVRLRHLYGDRLRGAHRPHVRVEQMVVVGFPAVLQLPHGV